MSDEEKALKLIEDRLNKKCDGIKCKVVKNNIDLRLENIQLKKQIDLMAEMIDELSEYYTRYHGKNNEFCKEICIEKDIDCKDCVKQYFAGLVEKE